MNNKLPYVVKVINASKDTKKIILFDMDYNDKYVIIDAAVANISYRDICFQNINNPYTVGMTYLQWRSLGVFNEDAGYGIYDLFDKYIYVRVVKNDKNVTEFTNPIDVKIDPFQNQKNVVILTEEIPMGKGTTVYFNMPGETEFVFSFYEKK